MTPTPTQSPDGPALKDVQFALDVDPYGELIFPAQAFVHGVTRVYARFAYERMEEVQALQTIWYLNDNPVSEARIDWDGTGAGHYLIWIEDPAGLGRGSWRWELWADGRNLGGGGFSIGGAARYTSEAWALSFDPPPAWELETETEDFVSFSSADQQSALALRVAPQGVPLSETAALDLTVFQTEHPDAHVVTRDETTLGGEPAILHQLRYAAAEGNEGLLLIVTAIHRQTAYNLWLLGPAEIEDTLKRLMVTTLRSIRFSAEY
jgi:hypothetical protein